MSSVVIYLLSIFLSFIITLLRMLLNVSGTALILDTFVSLRVV